jgi:hypothetical protein
MMSEEDIQGRVFGRAFLLFCFLFCFCQKNSLHLLLGLLEHSGMYLAIKRRTQRGETGATTKR